MFLYVSIYHPASDSGAGVGHIELMYFHVVLLHQRRRELLSRPQEPLGHQGPAKDINTWDLSQEVFKNQRHVRARRS